MIFSAVLLAAIHCHAATVTWIGGSGDNSWQNPKNWSGNALPSAVDDVVIHAGTVALADGVIAISGLTLANGVNLTVQGNSAHLTVNNGANVDGNLYVSGGSVLSLPGLTFYPVNKALEWKVEGANSIVDIPNLTNLVSGSTYGATLGLKALSGGPIQLPKVVQITDPQPYYHSGVTVLADGPGDRRENQRQFRRHRLLDCDATDASVETLD